MIVKFLAVSVAFLLMAVVALWRINRELRKENNECRELHGQHAVAALKLYFRSSSIERAAMAPDLVSMLRVAVPHLSLREGGSAAGLRARNDFLLIRQGLRDIKAVHPEVRVFIDMMVDPSEARQILK